MLNKVSTSTHMSDMSFQTKDMSVMGIKDLSPRELESHISWRVRELSPK